MQPTPRRALRLTAVLASACALTGCAAFASSPTTTATPEATLQAAPTSTFLQTPAVPNTSAPNLATTGANLPAVVASLIKYGQWLIANPDPSKAVMIAAPGCSAATQLIAETQSLIDQNAYVTTSTPTVTAVRWPSPSPSAIPLGDRTSLDIQVSRPAEAVTPRKTGDQTQILAYLPELKSTTVRITLVRSADKKWRFCDVTTPLDGSRADSITALL
ncbi:hypothetical protein BJY16_008228 [Actinoplanes octamycinicus]|uniref:Mce-associated membrane protein n=1 Tax=Actinoplanes octamycinicus TaxID=135948 RepID=A0A7W7MC39_9ACTN|nr:hypothetical protein [Actinoplanes octamycinicus]MBB4744769.1 hypothetical protein [Actinoplanes octamycinicus]GIE55352.1 hypothetical protein Aoc01nite_07540 [Actinoplanes octamycinicus]